MSKEKKNDLTLKIFALLLAIFLWSYVMSEVNPEIIKKYPNIDLEFSNAESLAREGLEIMDPKEAKVSVQVTGKKSDMDNFSPNSIKAIVDLTGYTEGQKKVPVKVSLEHMSDVKILNYEPKEVLITFDKLITKEKNVSIRTIGELEETYVLGDISTKTETILLKGPRSWINEITDVVAYVDLNGRKKDSVITTQIRLLNDDGNDVEGVEKEPSSIDIGISILRSKEVPIDLKTDKDLPEDLEMKQMVINPNKVRLKGTRAVLDLNTIPTKTINMEELVEKDEVKVELDLPKGIELLDPNEEIKVSLNVVESKEKVFNINLKDIEVRNLGENFKLLNSLDGEVSIVIKGDKSKIDKLNEGDIEVYIDLENLEEGSHQVDIGVVVPNSMVLKEISPVGVNVELVEK